MLAFASSAAGTAERKEEAAERARVRAAQDEANAAANYAQRQHELTRLMESLNATQRTCWAGYLTT